MSKPKPDYWMAEAGTPPNLQALAGRRVLKAYLLPGGRTIVIVFESPAGEMVLMAEAVTVNGNVSLRLEVGELISGFDDIPELDAQPHLIGLEFTELDGEVLVFGDFGVLLQVGKPVKWVKKKV